MVDYLKKYPLTLLVISVICYLSFFKPPQTEMETIPGIDKLVHTCMYGGLCFLFWTEYLRTHRELNRRKILWGGIILPILWGGIILPILMSGIIELLQSYCTEHRGGDWLDFAANSLGVLLAAMVGYYILRPLIWKKKK